ncbi:hypothetical protein AB833_10055 [Chromatiales bacterium (ex Bugula neritina AB1)]|nr:hypothetical protein AB833_10055 [Chromatiales bacterium (ex Bugula neritina AB1)]
MNNACGSLLMVLAMAAFAVEDLFIKSATLVLPVGQVLMMFGTGGVIIFAGLARYRGDSVFNPSAMSRTLLVRSVFELR